MRRQRTWEAGAAGVAMKELRERGVIYRDSGGVRGWGGGRLPEAPAPRESPLAAAEEGVEGEGGRV